MQRLLFFVIPLNVFYTNCINSTSTQISQSCNRQKARIDTLKYIDKEIFSLYNILNVDSFPFIEDHIFHRDYLSFESTVAYLNKKFKTHLFDNITGLAYSGFLTSNDHESYLYILEIHIKNKKVFKSIIDNMSISKEKFKNEFEGPYDWDYMYNDSSGIIIFYETGLESPDNEIRILLKRKIKQVLSFNKE